MQRATNPRINLSRFLKKDSQDSIKKIYGNCKTGGYTTDKTKSDLVETKLCCDTNTEMVYYSFVRRGKVYPLSPYLIDGEFVKFVQINSEDYALVKVNFLKL